MLLSAAWKSGGERNLPMEESLEKEVSHFLFLPGGPANGVLWSRDTRAWLFGLTFTAEQGRHENYGPEPERPALYPPVPH